jgi:hypothetical protein
VPPDNAAAATEQTAANPAQLPPEKTNGEANGKSPQS